MKLAYATLVVAIAMASPPASAYQLKRTPDNGACKKDGSECRVYCDNGHLAGSMYWNGSVWTDGAKWDKDMDTMAKKIVAADGTACS